MSIVQVHNVSVKALSAAVPKNREDNLDCTLIPERERELLVKTTGIRYRRVVKGNGTAADLCLESAKEILSSLQWDPASVNYLIFVTQTPDYLCIPATACKLQHELALPINTIAFDLNLGCSGYVYGLHVIASLMSQKPESRGLLLVGDVSSKTLSKEDRSTVPLFSDAGSATALEYAKGEVMDFNLFTSGAEYDAIIIPEGGYRNPYNSESSILKSDDSGIKRSGLNMKLNGLQIFNFGIREIAPSVKDLLFEKNSPDYFIAHQANALMLESIRKKLEFSEQQMPLSLKDFGNTSSASIPLTMVHCLSEQLKSKYLSLVLSGFGVGLSWANVYLSTQKIVVPPLIELDV